MLLNESATAILKLCDGERLVEQIVDAWSEQFTGADRNVIATEVTALLTRFENAVAGDLKVMTAPRPYTLVAELTYRCPLRCPYAAQNPINLQLMQTELSTEQWQRVFSEAADLGVVQVHLSGGEPVVRKDLAELIRHARQCDLYTNLITGGTLLTEERLQGFVIMASITCS